jgi:Kef-type K+ transport system membrane component KefB
MENTWAIASLWMALALAASVFSIRIGLSVALAEILVGIIGGNFLGLHTTAWIDFLASFGAVLLTFLAGAEIDPMSFRRHLKKSLSIGTLSFLIPFLGTWLFAYFVANWDFRASLIAGIALSTTSVAVVYAVMIETGLNNTDLGKLILAACFVTDLGTVLALGILFAHFNYWMIIFIGATIPTLWLLPKVGPWVIARWGKRTSETEVKFFLLVLFFLGWLATSAKSEAVLPAYLVGLVSAGAFVHDRALLHRMRTVAFAALTPFYFLKAGLYVALSSVVAGFGLILAFLGVKIASKFAGVWSLARAFRMGTREGNYTTLLMSTGLTFGSISALFGLTNGIINKEQYTILVTVVIGSAVVPTIIAQTWFQPSGAAVREANPKPIPEKQPVLSKGTDSVVQRANPPGQVPNAADPGE